MLRKYFTLFESCNFYARNIVHVTYINQVKFEYIPQIFRIKFSTHLFL